PLLTTQSLHRPSAGAGPCRRHHPDPERRQHPLLDDTECQGTPVNGLLHAIWGLAEEEVRLAGAGEPDLGRRASWLRRFSGQSGGQSGAGPHGDLHRLASDTAPYWLYWQAAGGPTGFYDGDDAQVQRGHRGVSAERSWLQTVDQCRQLAACRPDQTLRRRTLF